MKELALIKEIKTKEEYDYESNKKIHALERTSEKEYVKEVLTNLKDTFIKYKIKYIFGEFQGGYDDGGFDSAYFADEEKKEIKLSEEDKNEFSKMANLKKIYVFENKEKRKTSIFSTTSYKDVNIANDLEDILYKTGCLDEYGSFAGEFRVNGTVKLDVFTYKWDMDGSSSVETFEDITDGGEL
jgi:hypothetical protein